MAKKKQRTPAEKKARAKKAITFFSQLVRGAVKLWFDGKPFIVPVDQAADFIEAKVREIAARK